MDKLYCQLCAEQKSSNQLLNLQDQQTLKDDTTQKLNLLNLNVLESLTVACFICIEDLSKACQFINRFNQGQKLLLDLKQNTTGNLDQLSYLSEAGNNNVDNTLVKLEIFSDSSTDFEDDAISDNSSDDTSPKNTKKELGEQSSEQGVLKIQDILPSLTKSIIYGEEVSPKKSKMTWADYPWTCYVCCIQFAELDSLREHSRMTHKTCNQFYCVDCDNGKELKNFETFVKHVQKHWSELKSVCPYCHLKVECISSHLETHYSHGKLCTECGDILPTEEAYNQHINIVTINTKERKKNRKRGTPYTEEELTCKLCDKIFKNTKSLQSHKELHEKDRNKDHICDQCGKSFFKKGTLTSHILIHHNTNKLPYICKVCQKGYLFQNALKNHVLIHSNIKPFACDKCDKTFRRKTQLKSHQIVHTDSLPFVCKYCDKAFKYKQLLTTHLRQHTGFRPYSCNDCQMLFTNWSNYNKHMKRRHNMDMSKKKITPNGCFPTNPETGKMIELDAGSEEWRNNVLVQTKVRKRKKD